MRSLFDTFACGRAPPLRFVSIRVRLGADAIKEHTTVVYCDQTENNWPHDYQDDRRPAVVQRVITPRDGNDVVSGRLDDVVNRHHVHRTTEAEQYIYGTLTIALSLGQGKDGAFRIEHFGQRPHNACQRTRDAKCCGELQLSLDVAENESVKPVRDIVRRPNQSIDEAEQIEQDGPGNQVGSSKVTVLDVPYERW